MNLQENTLFDLDFGVKVTRNVEKYPPLHVTYTGTKFEVATSKGVHLQENKLFDLDPKVTHNVAQYPPHHVTYPGTKIVVAMSNCLGGDTFTRNVTDRWTHRTVFGRILIYLFF